MTEPKIYDQTEIQEMIAWHELQSARAKHALYGVHDMHKQEFQRDLMHKHHVTAEMLKHYLTMLNRLR